jgi:transposase
MRRQLGALPVLYALLETLRVRETINRYCPTQAEVDHGSVALVLIINRLMMPLPLYQIADWLAQTVLVCSLGVPASKFNDDRLGRTLDAISPYCAEIWQAVIQRALVQAGIDLDLIFYDLTAFITHGRYEQSQLVDFGFAHNTPMDKRKFKIGLDVSADGGLPLSYEPHSGRTADTETVEQNMKRLKDLLRRHGWPIEEVMIIGDRAILDDELAVAYEQNGLRYLAGLRVLKKVHKDVLLSIPERQFYRHPLRKGYWGIPCLVPFEHEGRQVNHRGLVVISGPMRTARRQARAAQLKEVRQELRLLQAQIGKPYFRTVKILQRRANAILKRSKVGKLMRAEAYLDERGQVGLRWWVDRYTLLQIMQRDGRYLLVTNDWSLSPEHTFSLYHQKDAVEKRFQVCKSDLNVSPVYLHKDQRIQAMLLINMLALLAYSLLERQVRQHGLQITARRIIASLQNVDVIQTVCWDGSSLFRLVPIDHQQALLLHTLAQVLAELRLPHWPHPLLPSPDGQYLGLPPPWQDMLIA